MCFDLGVLSSFYRKHLPQTHLGEIRSELVIFPLHICVLQDRNFNAGPDTVKLFPQPAEHRRRSFVAEMMFSRIKELLTLINRSCAIVTR